MRLRVSVIKLGALLRSRPIENVDQVEQSKQLGQSALQEFGRIEAVGSHRCAVTGKTDDTGQRGQPDVGLDEAAGMLGAAELDLGRSFQIKKDVARITCAAKSATEIDRGIRDGCCRRSRGQMTHRGQDDVRLDEARRRRTWLRRAC